MNTSFERIGIIAKEMQHLLWKPERAVTDGNLGWWNCAEHSIVTSALMWINGRDVEMVKGKAFFAQGPKPNGATPCLHAVMKHFWITVKDIGLVDFSPDLSVGASDWDACEFDYVFANKVVAPLLWSFEHTGRVETRDAKLIAVNKKVGGYACIYLRDERNPYDPTRFLRVPIITNQNGETWAQAALLYHLQRLLEGERESLRDLPMEEAWNTLRSVPQAEIALVTDRLVR
jgi:hypothetical protein